MRPGKPKKTAADFMVIGLSPALIMTLVGSLCFFLIEVFYRGKMQGSVRWVMFWFVVAITLVSRIAIEQSSEYAAMYGFALAVTVWFYLIKMHPEFYALGLVLLAIVWYCAHKLVWDCTLIDDDQDASGQGLLQSRPPTKEDAKTKTTTKVKAKRKGRATRSPGLWVVYFSLAALPLFGIGQSLMPADAADSRRRGVTLVVLYMSAALGLLVTTSFLALRRYLRQRYLRMPAAVAWSWLKLGVGVAAVILVLALFLPRPGATRAWTALRQRVDDTLQQASKYASKNNTPGQGNGRPGNDTGGKQGESQTSGHQSSEQSTPGQNGSAPKPTASPSSPPGPIPSGPVGDLDKLLRLAAIALVGWWLFRCRYLLLEIARTMGAAIMNFIRQLLDLVPVRRPARRLEPEAPRPKPRPLSDYKNPFLAGKEYIRCPAEIIIYTYEFAQAWARENGMEAHPEQTAREFCQAMAARWPELAAGGRQLSYLYAHAAYGQNVPPDSDMEPLKELWRQLTFELSVAHV